MNCTGLHQDFHATLEQSRQAVAKVARLASESQAECERMAKRIETLESVLNAIYEAQQKRYYAALDRNNLEAFEDADSDFWESFDAVKLALKGK